MIDRFLSRILNLLSLLHKSRAFSFYIVVLFLVGLLPAALGQFHQYSTYEVKENLSRGLIKDVVTDKFGYLWTATDEGVVKFNGENAQFFKDEINGGFAKSFCKSANGKLLVLHDFGLTEIKSFQDTVMFEQILHGDLNDSDTSLHYPKTIFQDKLGTVWIGENQSIVRFSDGRFQKYRMNVNLDFGILSRSFSFIEDEEDRLWVVSHSGQLFYYDRSKDQLIRQPISIAIDEVSSIVKISNGAYWIGAKSGIYEIELSISERPIPVDFKGGPIGISCLAQWERGDLFIGTWKGGTYTALNTSGDVRFRKIDALAFQDIVGFSSDPINGLWVCGHENISLVKPVLFDVYDFGNGSNPSIQGLSLNQDGSVLVISDELEINTQEIYFINNNQITWRAELPNHPAGNIPMAAILDDEQLWIGDLAGTVYQYDNKTRLSKKVEAIKSSNSPISFIKKDGKGNVWIAGNKNQGLIKVAESGKISFYKNDGILNSTLIYLGKNNEVIIGGSGQKSYLFRYNEQEDKFENLSLPLQEEMSGNFEVIDIAGDSNGNLILATNNGIFNFQNYNEKASISQLDLIEVPINEPSNALALSDDGTLWVSTTSGLVAHRNNSSFLFDRLSGLPSNSLMNRGLLFDGMGNLWVATARGLAIFRGEKTDFRQTPTPIFNSLKTGKTSVKSWDNQPLVMQSSEGAEVGFLSLLYPTQNIKYRTRILERDSAWSAPSLLKQKYLGGLPPGQYTFEVSAQHQEGMLWSEPASMSFEIVPPWNQQWWAYLLFGLLAIGLVAVVSRLYNLNLIRQKKNLESIIKERTGEINRQKNEIIEQQKKIIEQNEKVRQLKDVQYQNELEFKNKQLTTHTLNLIQKNQTLKELRLKINQTIRSSSKSSYQEMRGLLNLIDSSFRKDDEWDNFKLYFEEVHIGFFEELVNRHPKLTSQDLRHCALIRLNLNLEEMATIIGISSDSIKTSRFRLKKKMDLGPDVDLMEYLMKV